MFVIIPVQEELVWKVLQTEALLGPNRDNQWQFKYSYPRSGIVDILVKDDEVIGKQSDKVTYSPSSRSQELPATPQNSLNNDFKTHIRYGEHCSDHLLHGSNGANVIQHCCKYNCCKSPEEVLSLNS